MRIFLSLASMVDFYAIQKPLINTDRFLRNIFLKKKIIIGNFLVFLTLLFFLEILLGDWFSKYNLGYHMREKDQ